MDRRNFIAKSTQGVMGTWLASKGVAAFAQGNFQEGKHYQRLSPALPVTAPKGKIEVIEFFWYGCPHCHAFEPTLADWVRKLPADVVFRRVHVAFRPAFEPLQKLYLSLEALNKVDAVHRKVFQAIHQNGARLERPEAIIDFVVAQGLDRKEFTDTYNSFGVQAKVRQGKQLSEAYKIDGVPSIGIHGQYLTSPSMAGAGLPETDGQVRVLTLADQLIDKVRKGG
ncbi:thiol:disulfide interchange protein DsbA/DsbL [Leptothrix ochracea]|uniref:thiol:disulfide interchange protein DsbA/DsbL n=1 Tax=Leptothrix ochracea TaxID=735331 RepID=UPI0034E1F4CB